MDVLGISCYYHDSAACLIRDGKIIAAAQEERFSRIKHDLDFPQKAIEYCLQEGNTKIENIDFVAFYEKPFLKFERLLYQFVQTWPLGLYAFTDSLKPWLAERLLVRSKIQKMGFKKQIYFLEHHLSHAASAFLVSKFKSSAILTLDGVGEFATTSLGVGMGNDIEIFKEIHFPHSLGLLYSTVTALLGFRVNNAEYKVMGLAPYGKPVYYENFKKMIEVKKDGSYELDMSYFSYHYEMSMPSKKFIEELGPIRKGKEITQHHKDIAASVQKVTEDTIITILNYLYEQTGEKKLCMAGGVALNSVANGKIISNTPFKDIFIQPAASDSGASLGAASYVYHSILKKPRKHYFENAFLGPSYSNAEVEKFLSENKIKYSSFKNSKELVKKTAGLLYNDQVIGWFQGRMEWGPRALGARSILANPANPNMKDILNLKVKHREHFRPFAPVVTDEDAKKFFDFKEPITDPCYYMLMVYPIKKEYWKKIPSVTHVDGSGRLQVIKKSQNPLYFDVIKEFGKKTGIPVLINTSFNIRGEPIVCTPMDAYNCMMGTGIDALVMENFLIQRKDNPKDMWDSEELSTKLD